MSKNGSSDSFHLQMDVQPPLKSRAGSGGKQHVVIHSWNLSYRFHTHFHPYATELVRRLVEAGIPGLEDADTDYTDQTIVDGGGNPRPRPRLYSEIFSPQDYDPASGDPMLRVETPYPVKDLDFTSSGAYSVYNWELFYHVPLAVAVQLSKNQRYADAQRWLHYIFDPTDDSDGPTPDRFWRVQPLQRSDVAKIEEILLNLATGADAALLDDTIRAIEAWRATPFRPYVVARQRPTSFMLKAVMAYLDNLIDWGDSLFRQDSGEAIDEAAQLYVLAANILGPRPAEVPKRGTLKPQTYASLKSQLDAFGNALEALETDIPFDVAPQPGDPSDVGRYNTLRSLGQTLYFCVPRNDKLLAYWDTVADRLFKIHNSLNFEGVFRQLPLFDPPIDPALLVRATAAGLDVGAVIAGLHQPLPLVRCSLLLQKATEIAQEVKALGGELLAAMEKEDNEALSILRARHETQLLGLGEAVRYAQWQESIKAREGVEKSVALAATRYVHYERLLGRAEGDIKVPDLEALDSAALLALGLRSEEPAVPPRPVPIDIDPGSDPNADGGALSRNEKKEIELLDGAQVSQDMAVVMEVMGAAMNVLPSFSTNISPWGIGASISFGGSNIAAMFSGIAATARGVAGRLTHEAAKASKIGAWGRHKEEVGLQSNLAAGELTQLYKQLRAAQIREAVAHREWENHQQQIRNTEEIERFLTDEKSGKTTNQGFYAYTKREVRALHGKSFQLAFDVARKAERALQHELGDPDLAFLKFDYLAGREGLLAGEKLLLDVKRMEMAYHDLNRREYELTKHVSLLEVDPLALVALRATGRCTVTLPEALFDLDCPGHYFRRVKTVALSLPCVAGPYVSVNCALTLLKSSIRSTPRLADGKYGRDGAEDPRFSDHFGSVESVVTSGAQNDSGLFEVNLRDERYLPFEYAGAVSQWQIELPADLRQFDYDTITDVLLHLRYTAREGGAPMRGAAVAELEAAIDEARAVGSVRLLSVRHDFPKAWAQFKSVKIGSNVTSAALNLELLETHYPFWSRSRSRAVTAVQLFAAGGKPSITVSDGGGHSDVLVRDPSVGDSRVGKLVNIAPPPAAVGAFKLSLDDTDIRELWIALTWGVGA